MQAYNSSRKRLLILGISCLFHCMVMLVLLRINNQTITHQPDTHQDIQEDIKSQLDYESSILAQSPYEQGATVMLKEEPISTEPETTQPITQAQQEPEVEQPAAQQTPPEAIPDNIPAQALPHENTPTDTPPVQQPIKKKKNRKSTGSSGSQNMTLAQVTQGFLKSMYQERGATPTTHLDAQTLARQAYSSKVWHILRQSVNSHKRYITLQNNVNENSVLFITLRADGSLVEAYLERPVTTSDLRAIEQTIQKAASTTGLYPPIPAQFHADVITLRYPLNIRGHQGMHSYELNYN
jgi:hypothetical protein